MQNQIELIEIKGDQAIPESLEVVDEPADASEPDQMTELLSNPAS